MRILRKRVIECYRREGVNHYDLCKGPVEEFYNVIIQNDHGQLHPKYENLELRTNPSNLLSGKGETK